jgi:eukaryotic-like serine/threonine-protein kinase
MDQLGEYLIRRLIGEGGMGKVYEAEERLSKRRVALKVLHQELSRSDQGRRLFLNEMQILAHLEHPNIVRSLASTEVSGELVMVLEYLDGRTLRTVLNEGGRVPWGEAVRIAGSIASALVAAHEQEPPIIHRDLKPENIMILEGGAVKVMDFGIAKVIEVLNQTNTQSVGTLQYMSPEQIDAHTIDHRSDLYCLGLIFYEMLAGRPPFQSASPRQLLNLQCTAEPPPLEEEVRSGLPKGVEQLVFQLLEKAPEDRPYFAQDIVDRLEPFQTAGPSPTRAGRGSRTGVTAAVTPHRSPAPLEKATRPGPVPPTRPGDENPIAAEAEANPRQPVMRADTIALVEKVDAPREIPTKVAIAIIAGLSLLAGITAYFVRSTSEPQAAPAASSGAKPPSSTVPFGAKKR